MPKEIIIFGKQTWPYTQRAREAKSREGYNVIYRDVLEDAQYFQEMLQLTRGERLVPVLVEAGQVTVGFGGT